MNNKDNTYYCSILERKHYTASKSKIIKLIQDAKLLWSETVTSLSAFLNVNKVRGYVYVMEILSHTQGWI